MSKFYDTIKYACEFRRVEVNGIDACSAPIVAKAHEFFIRVSIGVSPKISSFFARPTG